MTELSESDWVLLADMGGTHARFACLKPDDPVPQLIGVYTADICPTFDAVMDQLCTSIEQLNLPLGRLARICLAVAANPFADEIVLTNNAWRFHRIELSQTLGCADIRVVNDFAAVARSLPLLKPKDTVQIGAGEAQAGGVMVAIGPGTGTGVASLAFDFAGNPIVLPGEGGHVDFAPITDIEAQILSRLRAQFGRVSIERLLCGAGIMNIYRALAEIRHLPIVHVSPEAVGASAQRGEDDMRGFAGARACSNRNAPSFQAFCSPARGNDSLAHRIHQRISSQLYGWRTRTASLKAAKLDFFPHVPPGAV